MPIYAFYYTVFILNSTLASRYSPTTEWEIGRYQVAQLKEEAPQLDQINHNERERERERQRERERDRERGGRRCTEAHIGMGESERQKNNSRRNQPPHSSGEAAAAAATARDGAGEIGCNGS
jgi:hypothetical protein